MITSCVPGSRVNSRDAFVREREAVELSVANIVLIREKIDDAMRFVDGGMAGRAGANAAVAGDGPVAARQLIELLAGKIVEIIVAKTGALARPEESFIVRRRSKDRR